MASQVAKKGDKALTFENPRVGAVIVNHNKIIATGYHKIFGGPHAEINAYHQLTDKSQLLGATMYVTLEPCASKGKVNSCAETMKNWGLSRVVIGSVDPNQTTNGRGIKILKEAGISVDVLNSPHSKKLNPEFYQFFENKIPYVQLKLATSQNDFVAVSRTHQMKLTDEIVDIDVHHERAMRSAIMIGSQTLLTDKPLLTIRNYPLTHHQPLRIVMDRRGRLRKMMSQLNRNWIIYTENKQFSLNFDNVILINGGLKNILVDLAHKNIQSIMVEGGPTLIKSFLRENLCNQMINYHTDVKLPIKGLPGILPNIKKYTKIKMGNAVKQTYINTNGDN